MPDFLTAEYVAETLPQSKTKPRRRCAAMCLVIGAGPTGLACAIDAQRLGLKVIVVDKGCLVNSLFHYPSGWYSSPLRNYSKSEIFLSRLPAKSHT